MTRPSAPVLPLGSLPASRGADRPELAEAARRFEAIFVRQMLAAARKASFGEPLLGGKGLETFRTMQDERFAEIAASSGVFGLGAMIERHLAAQVAPEGKR
ncbi:MAG: rod-binding protein [Novosphingobium sp.]